MGLPAYPDVRRTFLIPFVAFASFPLAGGCFHKADDQTVPAANQDCAGRCVVEGDSIRVLRAGWWVGSVGCGTWVIGPVVVGMQVDCRYEFGTECTRIYI